VKLLLIHKADSRKADDQGVTPLMCAARSSRRGTSACLQALLQAGAGVNTAASDGSTALHHAVMSSANADDVQTERKAIVAELLANKANVSAADMTGKEPLHVACSCCSMNIVHQLINAVASIEARDQDGKLAKSQRPV
jgi:ankyrin repeat protein